MTEQLKTLMERAADQDFAAVDLDAITAAGDRTVRNRRVAAAVAGVASLTVVAAGAVLLDGDDGGQKTDFVDRGFESDVPMWTEGGTLYTPDRTYDLGVDVASFVRTSEGIVFLGWDGKDDGSLGVYSFSGDGQPELIGETTDSRLRGDPDSPYVGWLDGTEGEGFATVVFDQGAGERVWSGRSGDDPSFTLDAIDGSRAYLSEDGGSQLVDLRSGDRGPVPGVEGRHLHVVAVEGELAAYAEVSTDDGTSGLIVGPLGGVDVFHVPGNDGAVFSPGGRWISVFGDQVAVYDTATGDKVEVDTGDHPNGLGYEWLDGDTLVAIAGSETGQIALLSCRIPAGTCTEHASLPGIGEEAFVSIGLGEAIWAALASEATGSMEVEVSEEAVTETVTVEPQ